MTEKLRCYRAAKAAIEIACQVENVTNAIGKSSTFHGDFSAGLKQLKDAAFEVRKDVPRARDLAKKIHDRAAELEKITKELVILDDNHKRFLMNQGASMRGYAREIQSRALSTCGGARAPAQPIEALPPIPKEILREFKAAEVKRKSNEAKTRKYHAQFKKKK